MQVKRDGAKLRRISQMMKSSVFPPKDPGAPHDHNDTVMKRLGPEEADLNGSRRIKTSRLN